MFHINQLKILYLTTSEALFRAVKNKIKIKGVVFFLTKAFLTYFIVTKSISFELKVFIIFNKTLLPMTCNRILENNYLAKITFMSYLYDGQFFINLN